MGEDEDPVPLEAQLHFLCPDARGLLHVQQPAHAVRGVQQVRVLGHPEGGEVLQQVAGARLPRQGGGLVCGKGARVGAWLP